MRKLIVAPVVAALSVLTGCMPGQLEAHLGATRNYVEATARSVPDDARMLRAFRAWALCYSADGAGRWVSSRWVYVETESPDANGVFHAFAACPDLSDDVAVAVNWETK